jgi:eukaryotic-like serine/threonine-protein kinase
MRIQGGYSDSPLRGERDPLRGLRQNTRRVRSSSPKQPAISAERWQRIQQLYECALPLEAEARAKLLLAECANDATLREQVLALLIATDDDGGELEHRVDRTLASNADPNEAMPGRIIGRYRVIRTLGRGGMGIVYLAERADQHYHQHVALKVMSRGLFHGEPAGRFRAERQILARLTHPHIARLLDGGQTENGTPFLVMEHVEGVRIDEYCHANRVTKRARLLLVQQVCAAVQYAHQNLIVHRDIKPSNILVTADGATKLLDFGIAKLLDPTNTGVTSPVTRVRDRVLTPENASPEQLRGDPVGTASDIYSLGVLLYELLSGTRPYRFAGRSISEIEKLINESPPVPPSVQRPELARELSGDLDNIVMKAMHRDPERRYSSAAALAQDIQNYLDGLPVRARPDTWIYRTSKFLRRNTVEVAGAATGAVLIATVLVFYTISMAAERDTAKRERQTASAVAEFMMDVFRRANPNESRGNTVTVREALDAAARRIDTDLSNQPRLRLTLMRHMTQAYNGLGLWPQARDMMESAVAQERSAFGNRGVELARSLETLGHVYHNMSRFDAAASAFDEAMSIRKALGIDEQREAVTLLSAIAGNFRSRQQFAEAIEHHRRAEALARALSPRNDAVLGQVLQAFAMTYAEAGDQQNAERYARAALPLTRGLVVEGYDIHANVLSTLGTTLQRQYKLEEAEHVHREFVARQTKQLGPDHLLVGRAQNNFGHVLRAKGDYAAAEQAYGEALRVYRQLSETDPLDVGVAWHNLGTLHHYSGELDRSLPELDQALQFKSKATGPRSPQMVSTLLEKSAVLRDLGRLQEARASFAAAQSIAAEKYDANDRRHALLLLEQGRIKVALGATDAGASDLSVAVANLRKQDDPAKLAEALASLGDALLAASKPAEARAALTESLQIRRRIFPAGHNAIAGNEARLANSFQ